MADFTEDEWQKSVDEKIRTLRIQARATSTYMPHQSEKERRRRLRQKAKGEQQ